MPENSMELLRNLVRSNTRVADAVDRILASGTPADLVQLAESHGLTFTWKQLQKYVAEKTANPELELTSNEAIELTTEEVQIISAQFTSHLDDAVRKAEQKEAVKQVVQQT